MSSESSQHMQLQYRVDVAQRALDRLQQSPYYRVRRIGCRYDGGTLVLHGRLPDYFHFQLAQEAVARLEGVQQVINNIEVA